MIQVQLDQFEDELKLSAEQQPEWNRYAERVAKLMDEVARARQPNASGSGNAVEQLDALAAMARSRVVAIDDIVDAGKRLYPLLTAEQKSIADRRLARIVGPSLGLPGASVGAGAGPRL
jgi:UTP-glucose-1-phosphate uridylyltransferase